MTYPHSALPMTLLSLSSVFLLCPPWEDIAVYVAPITFGTAYATEVKGTTLPLMAVVDCPDMPGKRPGVQVFVAAAGKNVVIFDDSDYRWLDSEREIRPLCR